MATILELPGNVLGVVYQTARETPSSTLFLLFLGLLVTTFIFVYTAVFLLAPTPRAPYASEKTYITTTPSGAVAKPKPLPCWHDAWLAQRAQAASSSDSASKTTKDTGAIDRAEVEMSVVIPAYNEESRIVIMLEEALQFLDREYGRSNYEILIVNDGSKDKTVDICLDFAKKEGLHDILRVCTLKENRGKGGAVTHGFRHVRGRYSVFADADGASRFADLRNLVQGCKSVEDGGGRGIAVGSRAHMVGTEAVVKRSALRNALMHSFHLLLRLLTPPATSRIKDTQCGFKLFSRASLPHIIPYMHAEGWIFDVEMLMLAESAPPPPSSSTNAGSSGIKVSEVHIGWQEVGGSKLNVMWDSLGMAYGLALLRLGWMLGVYRRR